nr:MAG TPA: hypothetical protein [Bacteriophage sp.]
MGEFSLDINWEFIIHVYNVYLISISQFILTSTGYTPFISYVSQFVNYF